MFSFKYNVLYFSLFNAFGHILTLVPLPEVEENDVAITEAIIRDTANKLFVHLRIRDVKHKPRLKDFSIIHNFFASMTLKDCDNMKEIARATRVNNIDNNTNHLITQINEALNEGDKSNEEVDDIYVTNHIETFITKLRRLKEIHGLNNNFGNLSINSAILKLLNKNENILSNFTNEINNANNSNESDLTDNEIWTPVEKSGRRIFDGHRTRVKFFPFMATVQFFEKFQCAGSIIRRDLVITAASCLQLAWNNRFFRENPAFLSVQVGCDYYEAGGENIPVRDVYFHPDYQPANLNNNLAVLKLGTNIVFSQKITKVKRIYFDRNPAPLPSNTDGIIILGWGARDPTNIVYGPWRNRLSYAELDFYPLHECQEVYSKEYVTNKNFCAGFFTKGTGACNHDVGGPGISSGILLGVMSFGPPVCGTPDAPTVFTKIGYYTKWIDGIMKQPVPQIVRLSTKRRVISTFALHYSDTTRKTFYVNPINPPKKFTSYLPPPTSEGSLRILKDDKLFKDFMSTMFKSNEELDYPAPPSKEKSSECDDNTTIKKVKSKTTAKSPAPSISIEDIQSDDGDVKKIKSKIKKIARSNKDTKKHKDTNQNLSVDEDIKLNDDITNLLDDLDLYKLLNSEEPYIDSDNAMLQRATEVNNTIEIYSNDRNVRKSSMQILSDSPNGDDDDDGNIISEKKKDKDRLANKSLYSSDNKLIKNNPIKKSLQTVYSSNEDKSEKIEVTNDEDAILNDNHKVRAKPDEISLDLSDIYEDISENMNATNNSSRTELDENLLYSSDKDANLNEKQKTRDRLDEKSLNLSYNDGDTTGDSKTTKKSLKNKSIKKLLHSSDHDLYLNENYKAGEEPDEMSIDVSDNDEDTNENMMAINTSFTNHSDEKMAYSSKKSNKKRKARTKLNETLLNLSNDGMDTGENMKGANKLFKNRSGKINLESSDKGENVSENNKARQKGDETSLNLSIHDEGTDENEKVTNDLAHKISNEEDANKNNKATTKSIQAQSHSSEKDGDERDSTQSDVDNETSDSGGGGLSIAD